MLAWKTVRVFISSTFRDMHSERDHLVRFVFPELRERCAKRSLELVDVDLRWGVTEDESRQGRVLEICLSEIERCRPFFVGLLGERYGWVPTAYQVPNEPMYDWVRHQKPGHSVTALEIYYGALYNPAMRNHCFFYFRDPTFLSQMPDQMKTLFLPENQEAELKLKQLKEEIRNSRFPLFENYPCSYAGTDEDGNALLTGMEEFGRRVLEDLWSAIASEHRQTEEPPDALAIERSYHETFIQRRSQCFIGRKDLLAQITAYVDSGDPEPFVVVTGVPGCGKSALLANFALQYDLDHPEAFVLYHFIGAGPGSTDIRRTLLRLCREMAHRLSIADKIPEDYQQLLTVFPNLLERTASLKKVVLILDAINQLQESHEAHSLHWVPSILPQNARLVLSTLEGDCLTVLRKRKPPPSEIMVGALDREERKKIVRQTLWTYRKRLDERPDHDQMELLLRKTESSNPLYLVIACEEMRLFGEFERVDQRLEELPDEVPELFQEVLRRVERDHNQQLVERALSYLECSRHGLLENEMLELLRRQGEERLPQAIWAPLYRSLQFYLRPPGETGEGMLNFFHQQLAEAVRARYLKDTNQGQTVHSELASHFRRKSLSADQQWRTDHPRNLSELPYHLFHARQFEELFALGRDLNFLSAQRTAFQDDPSMVLETLQLAIQAAADTDHASVIAEFVLRHAKEVSRMHNESPLEALRAGNLERAWELADLHDIQRCAVWHLLLAWELKDNESPEASMKTLERLQKKELVPLSDWMGKCAARFLHAVFEISPDITLQLRPKLLEEEGSALLCKYLVASRHFLLAVEIGRQIGSELVNAEALLEVVKALARTGAFVQAMDVAKEIRSERNRVNALIEIAKLQTLSGDMNSSRATLVQAVEIADLLEDGRSRAASLSSLAEAQAELCELNEAMETAKFLDESLRAGALIGIARGLTKRTDRPRTDYYRELVRNSLELGSVSERLRTIREIAKVQAAAGDLDASRATFAQAVQVARATPDQFWREAQLGEVAQAQAEAGAAAEAMELVRQISLVHKAKPLKEIAKAWACKDDYAKAGKSAASIVPDLERARAFQEIAAAQARAGHFTEAMRTLKKEIKDPGVQTEALSAIASAQAEAGAFVEAMDTASQIRSEYERPKTIGKIAQAQAKAGFFAQSIRTVSLIQQDGEHSKALSEIARIQARASMFEEAVQTAGQIKIELDRLNTLIEIAEMRLQSGDASSSRATFSRAIQLPVQEISKLNLAEILKDIAKACSEAEDFSRAKFSEAIEIATQISPKTDSMKVMRRIAEAQAQTGAFREAIETASKISDHSERLNALREIAILQGRAGDFDSSRATFQQAIETAGQITSESQRGRGIVRIAEAQALTGAFADAFETAKNVGKESYRSLTLGQIAKVQAQNGDQHSYRATMIEVMKTASKIDSSWDRLWVFTEIAEVQAQAGELEDAIQTSKQEIIGRQKVLAEIAKSQAKTGDLLSVRKTLAEAIFESLQLNHPVRRAEAFCGVAEAYEQAGDQESAEAAFAQAIETVMQGRKGFGISESEQAEALGTIAITQVRAGFLHESVLTAQQISRDLQPRLAEICSTVAESGKRAQFSQVLIPCAYYTEVAYRICGLLAQLYPGQAQEVAAVILQDLNIVTSSHNK